MSTNYSIGFAPAQSIAARSAMLDILGVAGLMALGALVRFPLPFTPVPVTLQTFVALMAGFAVGPGRATAGVSLYAVLGLAGAPLFAVSSGATLGYLAGFAAVPGVATLFRRRLLGLLAATVVIYALGAGWLCWWASLTPGQAFMMGVLPFLPGDLLKVMAANAFIARYQTPGNAR
jgi:biotin transport system substrate-specific component